MAAFTDIMKAILPVAGMGAGAIFGGAPGAAIGGSVAGVASGALGLLDKPPAMPGPSGAQQSLLATQMGVVSDIQGQQGVTPGQVSRMEQTATEGRKQQLQQINAIQQLGSTPLEREQISKALLQQMTSLHRQVEDKIAAFDAETEAQKADRLSRATAIAGQQAAQIQQIEANKKMAEMQMEQAKWNNFGTMIQQGAQGIASTVMYQDKLKAEEQRSADMKKFREDYLAILRGDDKTPYSRVMNQPPSISKAAQPTQMASQNNETVMQNNAPFNTQDAMDEYIKNKESEALMYQQRATESEGATPETGITDDLFRLPVSRFSPIDFRP